MSKWLPIVLVGVVVTIVFFLFSVSAPKKDHTTYTGAM
jgi:hypothetical protein